MSQVADLLRSDGDYAATSQHLPITRMAATLLVAGFAYGLVMGSHDGRILQSIYSGIKVPVLILVATIVSLPSFYVVNILLGLREDFLAAVRGVFVAQVTASLCLLSAAPIVALSYISSDHYPFATFVNGLCFAIASLVAQRALAEHYRPLIASNARHRIALTVWLVLFVIVAIQWAWTLRPFIGWPDADPTFLREHAWGNAYVKLFDAIGKLLR